MARRTAATRRLRSRGLRSITGQTGTRFKALQPSCVTCQAPRRSICTIPSRRIRSNPRHTVVRWRLASAATSCADGAHFSRAMKSASARSSRRSRTSRLVRRWREGASGRTTIDGRGLGGTNRCQPFIAETRCQTSDSARQRDRRTGDSARVDSRNGKRTEQAQAGSGTREGGAASSQWLPLRVPHYAYGPPR